MLRRIVFLQSSKLISKRFSTEVVVVGKDIPANLKLADESVLKASESPALPAFDRWFPLLPKSLPPIPKIAIFTKPGTFSNELAPLNVNIFGVALRQDIVNDCVRYLRNMRRQPKKTLRTSEISGSNAKPWPQKRQGKSQVGKKRNSVWRHGQKAHGPKIRDYSISLPRKLRALGMMTVLASKFREGNLLVVDNFDIESNKTKDMIDIIKNHGISNRPTMLCDVELGTNLLLAARNIQWLSCLHVENVDVYNIMQQDKLVITVAALEKLQENIIFQYRFASKTQRIQRDLAGYQAVIEYLPQEEKEKLLAINTPSISLRSPIPQEFKLAV